MASPVSSISSISSMSSSSSSEWYSSSSEEDVIMHNMIMNAAQVFMAAAEGSSQPLTRRAKYNRDQEAGHDKLVADYFADEPVYPAEIFRRRFRMSRRLFLRIAGDMAQSNPFFTLRNDARGQRGFSNLQKCTSAIRQLAYGYAPDALDEYIRMSERTAHRCLYKFCQWVVKLYSKRYLRKPNANDVQKLYQAHEQRHGFPGMLGSIDCMHWQWQNCPVAWQGQYTRGDQGHPTIILEAVASQDLWIWHAFFGLPGSLNDLNIIYQSQIFDDVVAGTGPDTSFTVSGVEYRRGYYLADGIYPTYSTIVKTIPHPTDDKRKKFAKFQEGARKDIERAFGVLQKKWHIISIPARSQTPRRLRHIIYACIILHNMIIEDEGRAICDYDENASAGNSVPVSEEQQDLNTFALRNEYTHHNLQADLVEYIWNNAQNEPAHHMEDDD
ncbi:putative harbinger transposase-derived protein [Helianthus annuus]|nr:putative harbinger transposase-derived protein [Helianthus annuus]KAJ0655810.1 putative harbinger transposase-derived protein [Helianthus annuus]KAJ0659492.1 putative harbinger transposase-derived protein [Helianthus annuus]